MRAVIVFFIRCYQRAISPWLPAACRYEPSCSEYARIAVETHGALKGSWLAARRLGRCHPFGSSGYDPVPPASDASGSAAHGPVTHRSAPSGPARDEDRALITAGMRGAS